MTTQCTSDLLSPTIAAGNTAVRQRPYVFLPRPSDQDRVKGLSDDDLLRRTGELTQDSRHTEAALLAHLGEIDARRLYLREACSSLFAYCTERLHFSEGEAHYRIAAARAAREHPVVLEMLADGRLHLTAVALLAPHLTAANRDAVLGRAVHRSKRDVEELVAELAPQPDVPSVIRKLPTVTGVAPYPANADPSDSPVWAECAAPLPCPLPGPVSQPPAPRHTPTLQPLAPGRWKVQFTAGADLHDKLERLQALMRATVPDGDLATIIDAAVTEKLAQMERRRSAATDRPRKSVPETKVEPSSRHVPAAVRRSVTVRDGGQCAYRDVQGRRCSARVWLQYHHRHPYGMGGDHSVDNVALLCHAHNRLLEEIDYGPRGGG